MKNLLNKIILSLIYILCHSYIYSQWETPFSYEFSTPDYIPKNIQFINPSTGYIMFCFSSGNNNNILRTYKTTDKGYHWSRILEIGTQNTHPERNYMTFADENNGWVFWNQQYSYYSILRSINTTDGGLTWGNIIVEQGVDVDDKPEALFVNANTGFLWGNGWNILYRTTNKGVVWNPITTIPSDKNIYDLQISKINSNIIYVAGYKLISTYLVRPYLIVNNDGFSSGNFTSILDGNSDPYQSEHIFELSTINNNGSDQVFLTCNKKLLKMTNDVNFQTLVSYYSGQERIYNFYDQNIGYSYRGTTTDEPQYSIDYTVDGGSTWNLSYPIGNYFVPYNLRQIPVIGNICYFVHRPYDPPYKNFHARRLNVNFNSIRDWSTSHSGQINFHNLDGSTWTTFNTPAPNILRRGGKSIISIPSSERYVTQGNDTIAIFYYWGGNGGNASMNPYNSEYYYIYDGAINADYKTKLISTTPDALKYANQTRSFKDVNGRTHLIYVSMEGIFYTSTKEPVSTSFRNEEILSGTSNIYSQGFATFNNSNPFISEALPYASSPPIDPDANVVAVWERREGNNIKIISTQRYNISYCESHWVNPIEHVTINVQNQPNFKAFPKIFQVQQFSGGSAHEWGMVTYLEPNGPTNKNLKVRVYRNSVFTAQFYDLLTNKNIIEYSAANEYINSGANYLHIAYLEGRDVKYMRVLIPYNVLYPPYFFTNENYTVSNSDISRLRFSPEISLKNSSNNPSSLNVQPVVGYQGQYEVRIAIQYESGPPIFVDGTYYPIYVRERLSNGTWSASSIIYNSLNTAQAYPNVEGSKTMNSCMLNYKNGNLYKQVVPRWNGNSPNLYRCEPNSFPGADAKFIRGGLINSSSTYQALATLSNSGNIYQLGRQYFTITDGTSGSGAYEEINGVVTDDYTKYSFNLGNIMVNWNLVGFDTDIDTTIEDGNAFNENLASKPFLLNDNDTLVIGRNAFYILDDSSGAVTEVEYLVKLMNKTTNEMHQLLAHDTVHTGDTIQVEYLEGFIITNIPNGTDSFYVQMVVDTLGDDFNLGGGNGSEGGGDFPYKRYIRWEKGGVSNTNNNIPTVFKLHQNFPNPFNPVTKIKFDLPKESKVVIKVYDLLGREVKTLTNEVRKAGYHEIPFDGTNLASGIYFYKIEAGTFVDSKKMVLIK